MQSLPVLVMPGVTWHVLGKGFQACKTHCKDVREDCYKPLEQLNQHKVGLQHLHS